MRLVAIVLVLVTGIWAGAASTLSGAAATLSQREAAIEAATR